MTPSYPTDLNDAQWEILEPLLPAAHSGGRPRSVAPRAVVNAILYVLSAGCAWRLLPHDFPKWKTVYHYFRQWRNEGIWQQVHERLRQWVRTIEADRPASPSAGVVDSQSIKSGTMVSKEVGYDGGKQVRGRKRHVLVDTLGLLVVAVVTAANVSEGAGLKKLLLRARERRVNLQRLIVLYVDGGYRGEALFEWVIKTFRWVLESVLRPPGTKGFVLLPKRWVVERTFGWFTWCRRLNRDYEYSTQSAEAWIYIASIRLLLRRLA